MAACHTSSFELLPLLAEDAQPYDVELVVIRGLVETFIKLVCGTVIYAVIRSDMQRHACIPQAVRAAPPHILFITTK